MRLPPPDPDHFTKEQRRVHDKIASGPRGRVRGPLALWLHRPELAEAAQALGHYCRYGSSLPPRLSELAIMTMVRAMKAEFPWSAHFQAALDAGVEDDVLEALRNGAVPAFRDPQGRLVFLLTEALVHDNKVPDELYTEAMGLLGRDALVDLVGVVGYYSLVAMTANLFEMELPDDAPQAFSTGTGGSGRKSALD